MRLGLVCISEMLKARDKTMSFKTMTRAQYNKLSPEVACHTLSTRVLHNSVLIGQILSHAAAVGIRHYRISSTLFPLVTDATVECSVKSLPHIKEIKDNLLAAGNFARANDISLSCHPDQYNVLASYNTNVVYNSINELNHQSDVMDMFGCSQDLSSPMCLHLNKSPDPKIESVGQYKDRFLANLACCNSGVQSRLVLENEDKGFWNCQNLYDTFGNVRALVYDNLHDSCNPSPEMKDICQKFKGTWGEHIPVFHWSEGIDGGRSHTQYASHVPECVTENADVVWEVELKKKDFAIVQILAEQQ